MIAFWFLLMLDKYKVLIGMNVRQCQYVAINNLDNVCLRAMQRMMQKKSRKKTLFKTVLIALVLFGLTACGQSGALYMPQDAPQKSNQKQSNQESSAQEQSNQEQDKSEDGSTEPEGSSQVDSSQEHDIPDTKES